MNFVSYMHVDKGILMLDSNQITSIFGIRFNVKNVRNLISFLLRPLERCDAKCVGLLVYASSSNIMNR